MQVEIVQITHKFDKIRSETVQKFCVALFCNVFDKKFAIAFQCLWYRYAKHVCCRNYNAGNKITISQGENMMIMHSVYILDHYEICAYVRKDQQTNRERWLLTRTSLYLNMDMMIPSSDRFPIFQLLPSISQDQKSL